jgi:hypothetical protein
VTLHFVHGIQAIGHSAQVQPFENHLILRQSSYNTRQVSNYAGSQACVPINSSDTCCLLGVYSVSPAGFGTASARVHTGGREFFYQECYTLLKMEL